MSNLWARLLKSKKENKKVQSKYSVIYENPNDPDGPLASLTPDPNWLAAALAGGVLPPIEAYLEDQAVVESYVQQHGSADGFSWDDHDAKHPYADPIGPMAEEEAIEYLIMKDVPPSVWRDYRGNRKILLVVPTKALPTDRALRNAWRIDQESVDSLIDAGVVEKREVKTEEFKKCQQV